MVEEFDPEGPAEEILTRHGPLSEDEFLRRIQEAGGNYLTFEELLDEIGDGVGQLTDGRWVWLPALLLGRVLTRRLTADELTHDILTVSPDLDPILANHGTRARFATKEPAVVVTAGYDAALLGQRGIPAEAVDRNGALLLPAGTLGSMGLSEGELVGVRLTLLGLAVERVAAAERPPVGQRLAALLDDDAPAVLSEAVWTLCHEDASMFCAPLLPLSEIIDEYGLKRRADLIAPVEFNFGAWDFKRGWNLLADRHDLHPDEALALYTLITMHRQMATLIETGSDDELVSPEQSEDSPWVGDFSDLSGDLGAVLADPDLAEILATETAGTGRAGATGLGILAETLESKVPRTAQVACQWLRAVALERIGDVESAEREFLAAESMDTGWAPVLFDLARFASDRGDPERALSLLRRADADPDDPIVTLLERHRPQPRNDVGRNDACWCGSGRKYKKCHLGREQLPLAERADWLYSKAAQHVMHTDWDELLHEVGYERSRYAADYDEVVVAVSDPLVMDAVLFEGGAFENFVAVRGSLLPDDELSLAQQWLSVDRSVFEVDAVHPSRDVTVRDVRTGDTHDVHAEVGSRQLKPGQLICTRLAPAGETLRFFGGLVPVPPNDRDELIALLDDEPDAVELVALLSRRFAPPDPDMLFHNDSGGR